MEMIIAYGLTMAVLSVIAVLPVFLFLFYTIKWSVKEGMRDVMQEHRQAMADDPKQERV